MKKIFLFSFFLILGLVGSQSLPHAVGIELFNSAKFSLDSLLYVALSFIMINVGREFELNKKEWRSYTNDYFIAMATAAVPWVLVCMYFMYLMPAGSFGSWDAWKENLLLSRFAAPTSAGILFTMLAAANMKKSWIYQKTQVLAIFDDLDTILLMIPLQVFMIGMKWQLAVIICVVIFCLVFAWKKLNFYKIKQTWYSILLYSIILVVVFQGIYIISKSWFGIDGAIHIEVLLPAVVLGMIMKTEHHESKADQNVSALISYVFMFLVGMSAPLIIGAPEATPDPLHPAKVTALIPPMEWKYIILHVLIVTLLSNIGKMFPLLSYRDRKLKERLALSIGMFTRGEVGAGIIFIAIGYGLGGPLLTIALLTLVANLLLTGGFVLIVKQLALQVSKEEEMEKLSATQSSQA